ncbi:MAG TPA: hypothetical protein VK304_03305 [Thermoleophilaceae bacterium]|nr:hypothetical protein [Thermoleophilaceae bacterium]
MKILDALRKRRSHAEAPPEDTTAPDSAGPPLPGYDKLDHREIGARLHELSQAELEAVESYERSHSNRREVLDELRYMHTPEPLPGYDTLSPEQIVEGLTGANAETVKAVRDYERKFKHRQQVMKEAARVLPTAPPSVGEDRARQETEARVQEGVAQRDESAGDMRE